MKLRTLVVPDEFKTIQEAVNHAQSGDKVLVLEGFYNENVVVRTDNITIRGDAFPVEILGDGSGFGVTVEANDIKLINLDIKSFQVGIAFRGNNYLLDEIISDENTEFGTVIFGDNGIIRNGSYSNNGIAGIVISGNHDKVINNRINNNVEVGLGSFYNPLENALICDNVIFAKESANIQNKSIGISFNLQSASHNLVRHNNINSNIAIISNGDDNVFTENTISASSRTAVTIIAACNEFTNNHVSQCPNGIVINGTKNHISENTFSTIRSIGMIALQSNNCIQNNLVVHAKVGISSVEGNTICNNKYVCVCKDSVRL